MYERDYRDVGRFNESLGVTRDQDTTHNHTPRRYSYITKWLPNHKNCMDQKKMKTIVPKITHSPLSGGPAGVISVADNSIFIK